MIIPGINPPVTIDKLVRSGLGFCCLYAFFRCYKQTGKIADRLGVSDRAVRYKKADFKAGRLRCEHCDNCQLAAIRKSGR